MDTSHGLDYVLCDNSTIDESAEICRNTAI